MRSRWRDATVIAGSCVVGVILLLRARQVFTQHIDADEFQHLHVAWCMLHGMAPYRDFFDNHMPLYWGMLAVILRIAGEGLQAIWIGKLFSGVVLLGILGATFDLARKSLGRNGAWLAIALLMLIPSFSDKAMEIRPDGMAALSWLLGLCALAHCKRASGWSAGLLMGFLHGLAFMFTPKIVFGLIGIGALLVLRCIRPRDSRRCQIQLLAGYLLAGFIPAIATFGIFALLGGLDDFIRTAWLMGLSWYKNPHTLELMLRLFVSIPVHAGFALTGLLSDVSLSKVRSRRWHIRQPSACAAALILGGVFISPAAQRQYYLVVWPLLSIFAARGVIAAFGLKSKFDPGMWTILPGIACAMVLTILGVTHQFHASRMLLGGVGIAFVPALAIWIWTARRPRKISVRLNGASAFICAIMLFIYVPVIRMEGAWSSRPQIESLTYIMKNTTPQDIVVDGWSGMGVFRPHAYYYWYFHGELRQMLSDAEQGDLLVQAMKENPPAIINYDSDMRDLPIIVRQYVGDHYEAVGMGDLYCRKPELQ